MVFSWFFFWWEAWFFQASHFQLLKLENLLRWSLFTSYTTAVQIWIISYILHNRTESPLAQLYGTSTMEHHHFDHCIMILNSEVRFYHLFSVVICEAVVISDQYHVLRHHCCTSLCLALFSPFHLFSEISGLISSLPRGSARSRCGVKTLKIRYQAPNM